MTLLRLRYVHRFRDRHGKIRHYLRRPGAKRVPLPGAPGSPEFMAAYQEAIQAKAEPLPSRRAAGPGSMDAIIADWLTTPAFTQLKPTTQAVYQRILNGLRDAYGAAPVAGLDAGHVERMVNKRAATPAAANHLLKALRALMQHAIKLRLRRDDPTRDVKRLKERKEGIASWTDAEIAAFEARWPVGTQPRLALALLLYTGQRRSDVVAMGPAALQHGGIMVRQIKTGAEVLIPLHSELRRALAAAPAGGEFFLMTGEKVPKGYTPNGFYMRFTGWAREAGLKKGLAPHGLRKAAARRLAEAGCTVHQIAAVTGHATLAEVQRYTKAAEQRQLAVEAIRRIEKGEGGG